MTSAGAIFRLARPKQWSKNLLVLAAPVAAGDLFDSGVAGPTLVAFVAFCLASSSVYCLNDVVDVEADRLHPRKKDRPVAGGEVAERTALVAAVLLGVLALGVAALARPALVALVAVYLVLQLTYSAWLKHEPVMDLSVITGGFLIRAVAGGLAADIEISQWFLLVAGFGSLFIVSGKRYSELHTLGAAQGTRRSLVRYTDTYLRFVWSMAAAATVMSYSLWAFDQSAGTGGPSWHLISTAPFVVGMLRYAVDIDAGTAAEPEDIIAGDRVLQGIGVVWLACVCIGIAGA